MSEMARFWFLALFVVGVLGFLVTVIRFRSHSSTVEKKIGPLPIPAPIVAFTLAALIVATGTGELSREWSLLRGVGIAISLYAVIMIPWTAWTLGRFFIPGAAVLRDHALVVSGPFRFVRHPLLSAILALWLGAALGTLNGLLLILWPLVLIAVTLSSRHEERLLREKFGEAYSNYAAKTGRFFPKTVGGEKRGQR